MATAEFNSIFTRTDQELAEGAAEKLGIEADVASVMPRAALEALCPKPEIDIGQYTNKAGEELGTFLKWNGVGTGRNNGGGFMKLGVEENVSMATEVSAVAQGLRERADELEAFAESNKEQMG